MIDVLEHIPQPEQALKELKRISDYVIFKVPLEDNLFINTMNLIKSGNVRKSSADKFGHINFYNYGLLKRHIENNCGEIVYSGFTNAFERFLNESDTLKLKGKIINSVGNILYHINPRISAALLPDFAMLLVRNS
jgi:hypothetical protein